MHGTYGPLTEVNMASDAITARLTAYSQTVNAVTVTASVNARWQTATAEATRTRFSPPVVCRSGHPTYWSLGSACRRCSDERSDHPRRSQRRPCPLDGASSMCPGRGMMLHLDAEQGMLVISMDVSRAFESVMPWRCCNILMPCLKSGGARRC